MPQVTGVYNYKIEIYIIKLLVSDPLLTQNAILSLLWYLWSSQGEEPIHTVGTVRFSIQVGSILLD